jgi:AcrR family transcriptional regulator
MRANKPAAKLGRPRAFDADKALDHAMQVFWRKGYEGASLSDLTKAMGINRPSLYAAFGGKEALFRKVLDRYAEGPANYVRIALEQPTAQKVIERLFRGAVETSANPRNPKGCLIVQGALACGEEAEPVRRELIARRAAGEAALRQRFERANTEGDLPSNVSPADLARYLVAVVHGMAVEAASGATPAELRRIVEVALRVWRE